MILDWLDRLLARILPVRTRNGGRHSHVKGDPFDRDDGQEFLPCMRPGSYSSAPDSPLAFRSFGDPNLGAAAVSVPLVAYDKREAEECIEALMVDLACEVHHPQTRVRPLPVPPLASERPDTPSGEQTGNWHQRPIEDTSLDMPKWLMRLLFCDHAAIAAELERDRERFAAKGMAA